MTNVIPFPAKVNDPVMRADTVAELIATGMTPRHGDYVFVVRYTGESGRIVVSTPGTGLVVSATVDDASPSLSLSFAGGLRITADHDAELCWYPTPR